MSSTFTEAVLVDPTACTQVERKFDAAVKVLHEFDRLQVQLLELELEHPSLTVIVIEGHRLYQQCVAAHLNRHMQLRSGMTGCPLGEARIRVECWLLGFLRRRVFRLLLLQETHW